MPGNSVCQSTQCARVLSVPEYSVCQSTQCARVRSGQTSARYIWRLFSLVTKRGSKPLRSCIKWYEEFMNDVESFSRDDRDHVAARLQAIMNTAVEGIISIDDQGIIESLNSAAEVLFGYTEAELVGRNVKMLMPSPYQEEHDGYLENYRKTGEKKIIGSGREVTGRRKDGTIFPLELSVSEVQLTNKRVFTGFVRDLTERHRSEEIERSLGRIVEDSLNEIFIFDFETLKFVQVNRGARENLGYSMKELRDLTPVDIKPEFTKELFAELVVPLNTGKEEQLIFETVHRRKDGSRYDVRIHLQSARFQGRSCYVAIVLDVTELKKTQGDLARLNEELERRVELRTQQLREAQEQLVRNEKLATLGQLAGGVAHEIRNPLGVIRNGVYFLQQIQNNEDEDVKEALDEISRGLNNSERIISELLDYARGPISERSLFPLDEAIDAALQMVRIPSPVTVTLPDPSAIHVNADRGQLERLLANLIQNAIQAMPEGGSLTLRCLEMPDHVITEVMDTGTGIDPQELDKIFEPLYTKRAKGIGLGLPLCRRYAEQNDGTIEVSSELGRGSTFTLTLPTARHERENR
ncbi:MAG: two-component system sensor kinase FixL [Pirellulaceae bacterium]|jgi:two-component system sensor kinase FixL